MPLYDWTAPSSAVTSPGTTSNRTRGQAITELCYYVGGDDDNDARARAGTAWDRAVRLFNQNPWKFNRTVTSFTLPTDFDTSGEVSLPDNFRNPLRMMLVDSGGNTVNFISYIKWREWTLRYPYQKRLGGGPFWFTVRNPHSSPVLIVDPIPDPTYNYIYPTLTFYYHTRIALAAADDSTLDVPQEVDEAIFSQALANFVEMLKGGPESRQYTAEAALKRIEIEPEWRDYEDFEIE